METASKTQVQKLHVLLHNCKLMELKQALVMDYTDGRTSHSREMYGFEIARLLEYLNSIDPRDKMIKKVFAIGYELGWCVNGSSDDAKMNTARLDAFLLAKGVVKKRLKNCNSKEMVKIVTQFEQIKKHEVQHDINEILSSAGVGQAINHSNKQKP